MDRGKRHFHCKSKTYRLSVKIYVYYTSFFMVEEKCVFQQFFHVESEWSFLENFRVKTAVSFTVNFLLSHCKKKTGIIYVIFIPRPTIVKCIICNNVTGGLKGVKCMQSVKLTSFFFQLDTLV